MKWVVYVLLAVNLGLLTWNLLTRDPTLPSPLSAASTPPPAADQDAPTLPLLAELGKDSLRERSSSANDTPPASAETPERGDPAPASAETATAPAEIDRLPAIRPDPPASAETPPAPAETDTPPHVGAGLPANPPPDSASSPDTSTIADAPTIPSPPPASAEAPDAPADIDTLPPRTCLTLGPLDEDAPLTDIQTWLEQRGAEVDVRTDERREVALYWIYFPPAATRREAVAQVERMREEGISDVIVVPKGDMANAISLGVFSRTDTRDRRLRQLNARGYQPSISPRYRTTLATWMDVSAPEDAISDAELQARWPELELARKPCPSAQIAANAPASYNPAQPPRPARRFFFSGQAADQPPAAPGAR